MEHIKIEGESFFKIAHADSLRPFFISLVSASNHWVFLSSNGGITAGRRDSHLALFPYDTDDKIIESSDRTGNKTVIKISKFGKTFLWEPFSKSIYNPYQCTTNLLKNRYGNKIIFQEINHDLNLTFDYQWSVSDAYGFVKTTHLVNESSDKIDVSILDGVQNIMPYGVPSDLQKASSNLVDAYKKNEIIEEIGLGIFSLSAIISDRAEPSEALRATSCWSVGLNDPKFLLSNLPVSDFLNDTLVDTPREIRGEKGAYLVHSKFSLNTKEHKQWMIIAEVDQTHSHIAALSKFLKENQNLMKEVENDVELGTQKLIQLVGSADGLNSTNDPFIDVRHYNNTLFNIMRGGVIDNNYQFEKSDVIQYLKKANISVYQSVKEQLNALPSVFDHMVLYRMTSDLFPEDFKRLIIECLPLKFSRRHGDPSRPWNRFSINLKSSIDGSKILDYQGNWRDIFQNWEALVFSYPLFIGSMIYKFLNASTFDGYNPYRVSKSGFDWEVIEPENPWSYIGYWGDHQIIYLLKFLEFSEDYFPGKIASILHTHHFVYANVPYRIKDYQDMVKDSKNTIDFDFELDRAIRKKRKQMGSDGALLTTPQGGIYRVNLFEKILATLLAKLSNFIPEGGIWLNTQRPEWNDANNALVGNGVSMVTLYYLRRFLGFWLDVLLKSSEISFEISEKLLDCFDKVFQTFQESKQFLTSSFSNVQRKQMMDQLGQAASDYRKQIYSKGFSGLKKSLSKDEFVDFLRLSCQLMDHSIQSNQLSNGMYHAYNLISFHENKSAFLSRLDLMLEGQVAAISSGKLDSKEVLRLLDSMKKSALYRSNQNSYLLYPDKELPQFIEKNVIPKEEVQQSKLLRKLIEDQNLQIVLKDIDDNYHFNADFRNATHLEKALDTLDSHRYAKDLAQDREWVLDLYEKIFNHQAFTGRSGTFFGYEGLGSIYWHMVSKLRLAILETCQEAVNEKANKRVIAQLMHHYWEVVKGIGVHKSPHWYGAFPTDPYSHTPAGKGAQQPGMTGQVKEDWISRMGELGLSVSEGKISFRPIILQRSEFLTQPKVFQYYDVKGKLRKIPLNKNELAFTYCQVPTVYKIRSHEKIILIGKKGHVDLIHGNTLDAAMSLDVFQRNEKVVRIEVELKPQHLR
ncbi:MAG: hypothetical protein OXC92_04290 [Flavobacteriaceae bacterium]|nr:hypothetical protein [Flavobacteriaceae bacterium]